MKTKMDSGKVNRLTVREPKIVSCCTCSFCSSCSSPNDGHSKLPSETHCVVRSRTKLLLTNSLSTMIYFSQGHFVKRGDG